VPKNFASRNAVSAVRLRLHFVISVRREAGIPVERDTDARVNPIGLMNSSSKISPGWIIGRYLDALMILMVVNNPHFMLGAIHPAENNPPLLVDSNAPESGQIPLQLLQPVAWGHLEILNDPCLIDHPKLAPGSFLDLPR
jgi:hypothetical protein